MVKNLHMPETIEKLNYSIRRLKYEEAIEMQLKLQKGLLKKITRLPIDYDIEKVREFINTLPFELIKDQKEVVNEIYRDFKKDYQTKSCLLYTSRCV